MKGEKSFSKKMHQVGRLATIMAIVIMLGVPLVFSIVNGVMPTWGEFIAPAGALLSIYVITALTEVISYSPMVGPACYITFITGNVGNMKVPAALNAQEITNSPMGTERGDAVSCVAVGVSSLTTMIVVAIGVVLLAPLQPVLQNPVFASCTAQMLPALFGCMIVQHLTNKRSGDYVIQGKQWVFLTMLAIVLVIHYFIMPINGKEGYILLAMIPTSALLTFIFYKIGLVKADEVKK